MAFGVKYRRRSLSILQFDMHDAEYVKRTGKNDKSTIEVEACLLHKMKENCCHGNEIMGRISMSGGDWGICCN